MFSWGSKAFGLHGHLHACAHTHTEIHVTKRSNKPFEKEKVGAGSWVRSREEAVKQLQKDRKQERRQCPGHKGGVESHVSSPEPKPKMLLRIGESSRAWPSQDRVSLAVRNSSGLNPQWAAEGTGIRTGCKVM